jgi:hypothetical protein
MKMPCLELSELTLDRWEVERTNTMVRLWDIVDHVYDLQE